MLCLARFLRFFWVGGKWGKNNWWKWFSDAERCHLPAPAKIIDMYVVCSFLGF